MPVTRSSLPVRLELSQGPSPNSDDTDCAICRETIKEETPTVVLVGTTEDVGCGHRFCEECMLRWLNSSPDPNSHQQRTCPSCRGRIFEPSIWELPNPERAETFRGSRRRRAAPTQYFALGDPEEVAAILTTRHPEVSEADFDTQARDEIALSDDMLDMLGIERLEINVDIFEISFLYRRRQEYRLPARSVDFLWRMSRLLGANFWYVAQLESAPEIGFLIPHIPALTILGSGHNDVVEGFYRSFDPRHPFATIQVPLETDFLLEVLENRNMLSHGRQATEISTLRQIRRAEGVTHWIICDTGRDRIGAVEIHVLPWPRGTVSEGFQTLRYPGVTEVRMQRMSYGWDTDEDKSNLDDFVEERIQSSAALMERRWVRSQHRLTELTGHPPVDESDEDTDDDEEAEDGESEIPATNEGDLQDHRDGQTTVEVSAVAIEINITEGDENEPDPYEISEAATEPRSEEEQHFTDASNDSNEDSNDEVDDYPDEDESVGSDSSDDSDAEENSSVYTPTESDEEDLLSLEADDLSDVEEPTPTEACQDTRPNWNRDSTSASEDNEDHDSSVVPVADEEELEGWEFLSAGSTGNTEEHPQFPAFESRDERGHQIDEANASAPSGPSEEVEVQTPRRPPEANQPVFERAEDWGVQYFNTIAKDLDMTDVLCDGLRDEDCDLMDTSPG